MDTKVFLASDADQRYLIQASTNLVDWVNISTNLGIGSFMDLWLWTRQIIRTGIIDRHFLILSPVV